MEQHVVARNPEVLDAIVVDAQRFQAALMLEPAPNATPYSTADKASFIARVWPSVEEANKVAPAHARIEKAMILPMNREKPAIRAGKGTIQRAATVQQYTTELDRLYQNADMGSDESDDVVGSFDTQDLEKVSQLIRDIATRELGKKDVDDHGNFFTIGIDSLQALSMTRKLRQGLRLSDIAVATVYSNLSIAEFSKAIRSLHSDKQGLQKLSEQTRVQSVASTIKEYQVRIRRIQPRREKGHERSTVLLTGSTGTLGTYLLDALLADPTVDHIYCLNCRPDSQDLQQRRNEAAGLTVRLNDNRVTYLTQALVKITSVFLP